MFLIEADTGTGYFDFASYDPEDPKTCMLISTSLNNVENES